jgi:NADPH-dependent glutamate synthase beta subunit-like oxidoreductase/Pyruvate/2-oxoacid:ferredoxin oxidoreductase delta subunit
MSTTSDETKQLLTFTRYEADDKVWHKWQDKIFDADHSHKCPEYVLSSPPCQASCPAGEDIRGYLNIVRGVEKPPAGVPWQEYAFRRIAEANPFPSVMGRVCPAPCESGCNRNEVEDFVGINSVEHFLGDWALNNNIAYVNKSEPTGKTVAVLGGGPAGLACAYQLTLKGHSVTIFDEHEYLGGMMRYGIPSFRTPRDVLDGEIKRIIDLGVKTRMNTHVGKDVTMAELEKEYDAIFMSMGAQSGRALPVPGSEAPNCVTAMAFLRAFNEGRLQHVGKRVVVIGGGDTSIDVATVARRLGQISRPQEADRPEHVIVGKLAHDVAEASVREGAEVVLVTRTSIEKMHANKHEVEQAHAEGIEIIPSVTPIAVLLNAEGRATGLRVAEFESIKGETHIKAGTERDIPADLIVSAIGQMVDFTGLEEFNNNRGLIKPDANYRFPGKKHIFVGGDVIKPHLLTTAIGHASIAADGIDAYLNGQDELEKRPKVDAHRFDLLRKLTEKGLKVEEYNHQQVLGSDTSAFAVHNYEDRSAKYVISSKQLFLGQFTYENRNKRETITLNSKEALGNFEERLMKLTEAKVVAEAKRCMSCGLCFECDNCVVYCPQAAVFKVKRDKATIGRYVDTDYSKCIGCHICADVCPTGYIQMGMGE